MAKVNKLGQYKGIEVIVEKQIITQEEVDQQIQAMVAQSPTFVDKDGEVENGNLTTIDFEGFKDGVAFDGGKAEGHQLEIGSGQFIPGFEEQIIGMKKGETKELNVTFPQEYGMPDLAGADVVFKVTVHNIQDKQESELNDEFAVSLNIPNVQTVEELKKEMEAHIQSQHDQQHRANIENAVFDKLLNDSDVEVSEEDIQQAIEQHIQYMQNELARQGMQLEQYLQMMGVDEDTFKEQVKPSALQQAKFQAVIEEIICVENIATTDEEANQQVEAIATQNQVTEEQVLQQISLEDLKHDYNRVKASQLVMQNAIVQE